jgi:hypothetical protein
MKELRLLVAAAETNEELALELIQNVRAPVVADEFYSQLDQRLQNMLSAAIALVDHTRRILSKYSETEFSIEFSRRNEIIRHLPCSKFLRDLRNYLLHYGMVPFTHTVTIGSEVVDSYVLLDSKNLLKWKGWNATMRDHILASGDSLRLRLEIDEYHQQMKDLYDWLLDEFWTSHESDIDAANGIVAQINLIISGGRTDGRNYDMAPSAEEIQRFRESQRQASEDPASQ